MADECEIVSFFSDSSGQLSPFGFFTDVQFTVVSTPTSLGDVTLEFLAHGLLDFGSDNIDVSLNGTPIGTIFDGTYGSDCPTVSGIQYLFLSLTQRRL